MTNSSSSMRCAMTGIEIRNSGDGIWDDGEWISWEWINAQIDAQEYGRPLEVKVVEDFDDDDAEPSPKLLFRILDAKHYYENTLDRISPDWGPIGEAYVAERFDVKLCKRNTEGHDGRLGNELIEVKTITPYKHRAFVTVKRAGNFSMLAVVRVTDDFRLDVRFIRRSNLSQGNGGKLMIVDWNTACTLGNRCPPLNSDETTGLS